jgi:hypothetical protein
MNNVYVVEYFDRKLRLEFVEISFDMRANIK